MTAPILIALTSDMVEAIRLHLLVRGTDVPGDVLADALTAAARYEKPAAAEPDLFEASP